MIIPRFANRLLMGLAAFAALALSPSYTLAAPVPDAPENALPAKRMVKEVQVIAAGGSPVDPNRIRANMSTHAGSSFSDEALERDIKALYATGLVSSVDISTQDAKGGGVIVVVRVAGRGSIGEVSFVGNSVIDSKKLKEEVDIKVGQPIDESKLFAGQTKVRELYSKKGFADVSVSYHTEAMAAKQGFVRVIYSVNEGGRGVINDIRFEGLTAVKPSALQSKMKLKEKKFYYLWGKAGKLDNDLLQDDIRTVERAVQDKGYVYAKVLQVRREPVKDDRVDLVFVIDEGKRYGVSEVALEGNKIYTIQELAPALKTRRGNPYSATFISDDEKNIADFYGLRGYADARVEGSVIPSGNDTVKIVYRITEGELIHVARINISGNNHTKDYVIRREVAVTPGDEFNTVRVDATRNRLKQMGYFSQVDIRSNATGTPGYKDLDISVVEQSTGTLQLGAGFSSIDSLTGFVNYTETNFDVTNWHNFKGGGQRFFIGVQYGIDRRDAEISLTDPWFLGHHLSVGIDAFYHDLFYLSDVYDERQYGVSIPVRKPIGVHSYVEARYTIQEMEVRNISADASDLIKAEEGKFLESKLELSIAQDTRDSLFLTRTGHKVELGGGMVGNWLGGDVDVYTLHATGSQYFNLPGDLILSFEGSVQHVNSWGDGDSDHIPIFERLFLGGANNMRGFKYRDVGPKDENGEPLGGDTAWYGTVELNFPIFGDRDEPKLRGAIFYDVGKVTGGPQPSLGGGLNSDFGVGLRIYLIPGVPIRVDVGFPNQHDQFNDHTAEFNFNLGYKF